MSESSPGSRTTQGEQINYSCHDGEVMSELVCKSDGRTGGGGNKRNY